jgi:hypothetical protein
MGWAMKFWLFGAILVVATLECGAAEARPRDDVMSAAFRCAAISDGRQWLDCYYGAAQPIRIELALPPASPAQLKLAATPPPGSSIEADVLQARDAVMAEAFHCTPINGERQWLECYYAAAQPMRAQLGLPPAPQLTPRIPLPAVSGWGAPTLVPVPQRVGKLGPVTAPPSHAAPQTSDHIVARIADYKFDAFGIFTLTLENGQTWRQLEGDTSLARLKLRPNNYTVTIKHGFFGSFKLTITSVPGIFRVRQVI